MEHGRNHDERQFKAARPRNSNVPGDEGDTDLEAELSLSGRGGAAAREGLVGAHTERARHSTAQSREEGEEPTGPGSDVAPTRQAALREQERHRLEREIGRVAAGTEGRTRDDRREYVDRESLEGVAREADRRVVGRELGEPRDEGTKR